MDGHILIADDDPDARQILSVIVNSLGITYKTVNNGTEALNHIRDDIPKIILLDLLMPDMDGFAVLSRLRGDPRTRYIPVIVVTACTLDQIDLLKLPGIREVIQKGNLLRLRTLIKEILHLDSSPQTDVGNKTDENLSFRVDPRLL